MKNKIYIIIGIVLSVSGISLISNLRQHQRSEFGRKVKINYYNQDGNLEKTSTFLYNDGDSRQTEIITDQSKK